MLTAEKNRLSNSFVFIAYSEWTKLLNRNRVYSRLILLQFFSFYFSLFAINYRSVESFLGACKHARQVVDVRERSLAALLFSPPPGTVVSDILLMSEFPRQHF